jgi:hypothetical protein
MMFHVRKTSVLRTIAMATSPWFVDLARTIWATLLKTAFNGKVVVFIEYCLVFSILPEGCAEYWWFSVFSQRCVWNIGGLSVFSQSGVRTIGGLSVFSQKGVRNIGGLSVLSQVCGIFMGFQYPLRRVCEILVGFQYSPREECGIMVGFQYSPRGVCWLLVGFLQFLFLEGCAE